jgi:hypothetical protein
MSKFDSQNENRLLPHPKSIIVGTAIVPWVENHKCWFAPAKKGAPIEERMIFLKASAEKLCRKIAELIKKGKK